MADLVITSAGNAHIKQAMSLREAKARREEGLTVIDGLREIQRAFRAEIQIEKVFICPSMLVSKDASNLLTHLKKIKTQLIEVNAQILEKIAFGQRLEGMVAIARIPQRSLASLKPSAKAIFVIAQGLEKPGNIGAILRTCDAVGVDGLILVETKTDLFNPNVIRASTGTVFSVPTAVADSKAVKEFLNRYRIRSCGLFPQAQELYSDIDYTDSIAIVLGSEDKGLDDFWKRQTDEQMKIPMKGMADSLNVSVCSAIVLYEAVRQRQSNSAPEAIRRSAKKF
jgi:TrmH family RNA methyltransferase